MNKPVFYTYDQFIGSVNESKFLDSISKFKNTISKYSNFLSTLGEDYEKLSKDEFSKKYSFGSRKLSGDIVDKFEENILDKAEKLVAESLELNEAFSIFKQGNKLRKAMLGFYIFLQLLGLSVNSNAATIDEQLEKATKTETSVKEIKEDTSNLSEELDMLHNLENLNKDHADWKKEILDGGKIVKYTKADKFVNHGWTILKRGGDLDYKGSKVDIDDTKEGKDSQEMEKRFQWINDKVVKLSTDSTVSIEKGLDKISEDFKKRFKDSEIELIEEKNGVFDIFYSYKFKDSDNYASADYKTSTGKTIKKGEKIPSGTVVTHLNVGKLKASERNERVNYALHVSADERFGLPDKYANSSNRPQWAQKLLDKKLFTKLGSTKVLINKQGAYVLIQDYKDNQKEALLTKYKDSVNKINNAMEKLSGIKTSKPYGSDADVIEILNK